MIRNISLAALVAVALSGCVTSGYGYRGGAGDYYYGRASSSYYGAGAPYGSLGYGYPGGLYGSIGYGYPAYHGGGYYGYGSPYNYYYRPGYGYYGRPYYPPYYPPYRRVVHPRHPHKPRPPGTEPPPDEGPDHAGRPDLGEIPWRNRDRLRDGDPRNPRHIPSRPQVVQTLPPRPQVGVTPPRVAPPAGVTGTPRSPVRDSRPAPRRTETRDRGAELRETP